MGWVVGRRVELRYREMKEREGDEEGEINRGGNRLR